jgi:acetolactate decarboxylase
MSELEFLGALHVELLRQDGLPDELVRHAGHPAHELFQTSTVQALLGGAFDGDVTVGQLLEHGDLGLGTLDGLDGELIVLGGEAWKAELDCSLTPVPPTARTPYAVVAKFSPGAPIELTGPISSDDLEEWLKGAGWITDRPDAVRIAGSFESIHVRSVPKQLKPYPPLAEAIAHEHVLELNDVSGTMVGFRFPDPLDGIEMTGFHLHFATDDRAHGGHVLSYRLNGAEILIDEATDLHVELPPAVVVPIHGTRLDQHEIARLESDS